MSRVCELTGKRPTTGNLISHSNIKTRTRWLPNVTRKKYLIPELGQTLTLRLSTEAVKTIDKVGGISAAIRKAKEDKLSPTLLKLRRALDKKAKAQGQAKAKK